jgi:O-Antigen ligase
VIEADRVLVYLGFFLAAFLIAQTDQRRQRFAEGIAISVATIAVLALASRLLPDLLSVAEGDGTGPRLRYPLGYWNADGIVFAIAAASCLWMSRHSLAGWLRWSAVAVLPSVLMALYFTYSRGGLLALAIACGCLIALSHDRLWLLGTLAVGAVGALPALIAAQERHSLADNLGNQAAVDEGLAVLAILVAGTALALALFAALRRLEGGGGRLAGRAVELSRNPVVLKRVAAVAAVFAIGATIAVGGRAWDQFTSPGTAFPDRPSEHFSDLSSANRDEFWRVALDAGGEEPVLGNGAGTYRFSWNELRSIRVPVRDAHSLYLQAFAELGVVGGLVVLAMVAALLWCGFAAWRAASGRWRELYALLFAVQLAFAVGAGIDWFWQIPVVGGIFFLASGALVAARCGQLSRARAEGNGLGEQRHYGFTVAGLAIAWLAALALIGPLLVNRELNQSRAAAAEGNLPVAIDRANTAQTIEPWAASPYIQLGLLAEEQGDYAGGVGRLTQAIEREDRNWLLYYLRARMAQQAGDTAAARADLREALLLNPEEACLQGGFRGCG